MMPHREEKIYLNALNVAFKSNFLKLFPFLSSSQTFANTWEKLSVSQKENINPDKEWQKIEKQKVNFIISSENKYPNSLKEISYPPSSFYIKGEIPKEMPCIAIVGKKKIAKNLLRIVSNWQKYQKKKKESFYQEFKKANRRIPKKL